MGLKHTLLAAATHDRMVPLWRPIAGDLVVVLMLHRFTDPALGAVGHSIPELRSNLEFLRRHQFQIGSLGDLVDTGGAPPSNKSPTIIFTVDDGYADFASVAAPVFAEFDCPATVFLVSGAVDGTTWFWWDRVTFAVNTTRKSAVELEVGGKPVRAQWDSRDSRWRAAVAVTEALKGVPNDEKEGALHMLAEQLDVEVPSTPPPSFAAMTWNDVRRCAAAGATFGPHTVTHPMLTQVSDDASKHEIVASWQRLRSQCDSTVPVFCYPNGAFTQRDVDILRATDLAAAVTTHTQYAAPGAFRAHDADTRFRLPRFAYEGTPARFAQIVTGLERVKLALRHGRAGWAPVGR